MRPLAALAAAARLPPAYPLSTTRRIPPRHLALLVLGSLAGMGCGAPRHGDERDREAAVRVLPRGRVVGVQWILGG